jgi:hypothetical protein
MSVITHGGARTRLPTRREHEACDIAFHGQSFSVGIGRNVDGAPVEVFVNAVKAGSSYDAIARDAGITLSIALQSGADLASIRNALTRSGDGSPASLLGALADMLAEVGR